MTPDQMGVGFGLGRFCICTLEVLGLEKLELLACQPRGDFQAVIVLHHKAFGMNNGIYSRIRWLRGIAQG